MLLRLLTGTIGLRSLARKGTRVDDGRWLSLAQRLAGQIGISRPLTLLKGGSLGVPVTWGIVYPVVLLPDDADQWDPVRRRYVLVHEMAHVRRFDALTQLVSQIALAIFWFSPFVWLAASRLRLEREHACDDYVLREGTLPSRYADDLLTLVRSLGTPSHRAAQPAFAALAMARRSEFEGRMLAILDAHHDRHPLTRKGIAMLATAVVLLAIPLAAFTPSPARATAVPSVALADSAQPRHITDTAGAYDSSRAQDTRRCDADALRRASGSSLHIHSSDDGPASRDVRVFFTKPGRCAEAVLFGEVTFSRDERSIERVAPGASAVFVERRPDRDWMIRFPSGYPTSAEAIVLRSGRPAPFDDAAVAWLGEFLPEILREAALNVPQRVARLRGAGGTAAVLTAIADMQSPNAKRAHYIALLEAPQVPPNDGERIVRQASRDLSSSPGDMRAVLQKVPVPVRNGSGVRQALTEGVAKMSSDGDKHAVLAQYVTAGDRELLLAALRATTSINSDGDKHAVLAAAAPHAFASDDAALREAFFAAYHTMSSDGDRHAVLAAAIPFARGVPALIAAIIRGVEDIDSDGDAAAVLVAVASQRLLTTTALRDLYMTTARHVNSDGDYRRVLEAAIPR